MVTSKCGPSTIPACAGTGLRSEHYQDVVEQGDKYSWVEVHPENHFGAGGIPHRFLERIRADHPVSFHGVGMSIGSADDLDAAHIKRLKQLIRHYQTGLVSEHVSWSSIDGVYFNDLLPIPYTEESLDHICRKVSQVQEQLHRQILLENASTYLQYVDSAISEWDFLNAVAERTACGLLLDVNNVFVNALNQRYDAERFISAIEPQYVIEFHLAGHTVKELDEGIIRIDSHHQLICDEVWTLFEFAATRFGATSTLIECDKDLPDFQVLLQEAAQVQKRLDDCCERAA